MLSVQKGMRQKVLIAAAVLRDPRERRSPRWCREARSEAELGGIMKRMLLVFLVATAAACGQPVDVTKAVHVEAVSTGWYAAGRTGGKNKIVPAVALKLKNVSNRPLTALQVNAVFRRAGSNEEFGAEFRPVSSSGGLAASDTTATVTLKGSLGYTGNDSHGALLLNSQFVDARVEVFVKTGSGQWTRVGEYPIARQLNGN